MLVFIYSLVNKYRISMIMSKITKARNESFVEDENVIVFLIFCYLFRVYSGNKEADSM